MCEAISPSVATDMACGVGKAAKRPGVALFTAASVVWADNMTATKSSK